MLKLAEIQEQINQCVLTYNLLKGDSYHEETILSDYPTTIASY